MKKIIITTILFTPPFNGLYAMDYNQLETVFGEPVTMGATGIPQRSSETPVSMDILTYDEIQQSGAKDIPQLLMRLTGLHVQRGAIGGATVSIRGYGRPQNNRVLILLDGREINTTRYGATLWDSLPVSINEIQQIEVIKGPNSSLYGFAAQTGVINIVTFSPNVSTINEISAQLGTHQREQAELINTAQFNDYAIRVSLGELASNGYNSDNNASADNHLSNRRVNIDQHWKFNNESGLRLQLGYSNAITQRIVSYLSRQQDQESAKYYNILYERQNKWGPFSLQLSRTERSLLSTSNTTSQDNSSLIKLQQIAQVNGNHSFRFTSEYKHNYFSGNFITPEKDKMEYQSYSPSFMWNWQITPKTNMHTSLRYDHAIFGRTANGVIGKFIDADLYDRTVEELSYNVSFIHQINNKNTFKFITARSMHIPSLVEYGSTLNLSSFGLILKGDPTLDPERTTSYEMAWSHAIHEHAQVNASIFHQKMENIISESITPGFPINLNYIHTGESESYGLEIGYKKKFKGSVLGASYTFMKVNDSEHDNMFYEDAQHEHKLSLYGSKSIKKWDFNADIHYISESRKEFVSTAAIGSTLISKNEGYTVLNATVAYNFSPQLKLTASGFNLIDSHHEWLGDKTTILSGDQNNAAIGPTAFIELKYKF